MASLQLTTCSRIPGSTWLRYISTPTLSSWLSLTRFVPTRILSSILSFSLLSFSLVWPWCCILTHSLFISAKLRSMKSMLSSILPGS